MSSFGWLIIRLCVFFCLYIFLFVVILSLLSLGFPPLWFLIFLSSSAVITDPNSDCETLILKLGSGGLPPALPPLCLFCSLSSPLPQYDSRWWLSLLLSPMMPQWCHSLLHLCLSTSLFATLSSPLSLLYSSILCLSHLCDLVFHLHCLDISV